MEMIEFMVIGLPRSATTWAANWLTTDQLHCVHDPLGTTHYSEWDSDTKLFPRGQGMKLGVACTTIWNWPEWVNAHPARKVILHRDLAEIQGSLARIGLQQMQPGSDLALDKLEGKHYSYKDVFDAAKAEEIWTFLTGLPFNRARHKALTEMSVQQKFAEVHVDPAVVRRLVDEIIAKSTAPQPNGSPASA
jgi:hypothetical protein